MRHKSGVAGSKMSVEYHELWKCRGSRLSVKDMLGCLDVRDADDDDTFEWNNYFIHGVKMCDGEDELFRHPAAATFAASVAAAAAAAGAGAGGGHVQRMHPNDHFAFEVAGLLMPVQIDALFQESGKPQTRRAFSRSCPSLLGLSLIHI